MRSTVTKQFLVTIFLIFILQAAMLSYIFTSFYISSKDDIKNLGASNLKSQATMIDNYLSKGSNALWFAAESVDFMLSQNMDNTEILQYLKTTTSEMNEEFDTNFTGIYGYINDEYLDGLGWVPPKDYNPKERTWYKEAVSANGKTVLSNPYLDAQTGKIIISITQLLSDKKSVVSLDVVLNEVQNITTQMTMSDSGYAFLTDDSGLVIAHTNEKEVGKNYREVEKYSALLSRIYNEKADAIEMDIDGESCTVFTSSVSRDWHIVIVAKDSLLFKELRTQMLVGILVSIFVYLIIVVFCVVSVKRISKAEKKERDSMDQLQRMNMNIIRSLTSTIDAKDQYTSGHSQRVADYALQIAKKMGKSEDEQRIIFYSALLHDVGKIRVPDDVINKPGRLTEDEFDQIKIHPVSGYHILKDIHDDSRIGYGAKYHHERYDGKGYPNGLAMNDIPEVARIIAVADSYDAMASNRSYRKLLPQDVVRNEIINGKGTQFDPEIADVMLEIIDEDSEYKLRHSEDYVYNILLMDDDKKILRQLEAIMQHLENVNIIGVQNTKLLFDSVENSDLDIILLDLEMQKLNTVELYKEIRSKCSVPIIFMTSNKHAKNIKNIRDLGADDFLTVPLIPSTTKETIHAIISRNNAHIE